MNGDPPFEIVILEQHRAINADPGAPLMCQGCTAHKSDRQPRSMSPSWYVVAIGKINLSARRGCASPHGDYVSRSVPSSAGHDFSKSTSRWSPRSKRAWIRCCASGHVSAVPKEVKASRSRSADGNETWLTRLFAA